MDRHLKCRIVLLHNNVKFALYNAPPAPGRNIQVPGIVLVRWSQNMENAAVGPEKYARYVAFEIRPEQALHMLTSALHQ